MAIMVKPERCNLWLYHVKLLSSIYDIVYNLNRNNMAMVKPCTINTCSMAMVIPCNIAILRR